MGALCSIKTNADVLTLQLQTGTILPYAEEGMPVVAKQDGFTNEIEEDGDNNHLTKG